MSGAWHKPNPSPDLAHTNLHHPARAGAIFDATTARGRVRAYAILQLRSST